MAEFIRLKVIEPMTGLIIGERPKTYDHIARTSQIDGITPIGDDRCEILLVSKVRGRLEIPVMHTLAELEKHLDITYPEISST